MNDLIPCVTVITPTYNQAQYLPQTIGSVLSQDYLNIEYIVINDGSTDHTEAVLKEYNGRITWETQSNLGEYKTIYKAFQKSRGALLLILSSDDYLLPGAISELVRVMQAQPELVVAYPDYLIVDDESKVIQNLRNYDYNFTNAVRWFACMPGPAALIRRSTFQQLGGRDTSFRFVGDFDFYLRAGLLGPFQRVPQTLAAYRWHSGSQTKQRSLLMAEEHLRLVRKFYSTENLPIHIQRLKSEAFGSAYYIAGVVCSDDPASWQKRWYYLNAFRLTPRKYLGEYSHRLENILRSLVGKWLQMKICALVEQRKLKYSSNHG